eukprot:TRINITY_DN4897_c0_g1_i1.p2 TRINITY_DN4897_c0_g1~~TRINITY_DN4897_c0_g1_i1.p2  ORF type:complete len:466 (-),score=124.15 TRINITY_DN4897_c0_g1_i1:2263-3660(-)
MADEMPKSHKKAKGNLSRTKTSSKMFSNEFSSDNLDNSDDGPPAKETIEFYIGIFLFQLMLVVLFSLWTDYDFTDEEAQYDVETYYDYFRDVNIMIFFGFGFLMSFLRRNGFGSIGYTLLVSALVVQWSIPLEIFFTQADEGFHHFAERHNIDMHHLLGGLFTAATVMISYGAVLGKVTPTQLIMLGFIEPIFYWVNLYIGLFQIEAVDVGGGIFIHTFGAYFGLAVTWWLTNKKTHNHPDNTSCYSSDLFSLAGTIFLWIMWPSFNAAIADVGLPRLRAIVNTFYALCGSTVACFLVSRLVSGRRFDAVHIQNSTLAGGVMMGVAADLDLNPGGAMGAGIVAGAVSVLGFHYLTPLMGRYLGVQDVCGVHNLHGMPGVLGTLVSVFAVIHNPGQFPHGDAQPAIQLAALGVTIGIALLGGFFTGAILKYGNLDAIRRRDFFNDRTFWILPTDYGDVVHDEDDDE